jgi:hypothetical protein
MTYRMMGVSAGVTGSNFQCGLGDIELIASFDVSFALYMTGLPVLRRERRQDATITETDV